MVGHGPGGGVKPTCELLRNRRADLHVQLVVMLRRRVPVAACAAMFLVATGCDGDSTGSAADCAVFLEWDGGLYEGIHVDQVVDSTQTLGTGQVSSCGDQGPEARGAYFDDSSASVTLRPVRGVSATEAVVVTYGSGSTLYFAGDVPGDRRDAILADLRFH
ncbi:DUF6281 family protein [Nocardioides sp. C4-1]|uniref:DUF6281 family protein n=1 Tax=Nocardioides sp. C4-1 TaxID=3151851 RepID=UPI0032648EBD